MNVVKKMMAGVAAMSLVAMPVAASAADASKLSLTSSARAGTSTAKKSELAGGGVFVAVIAAIAVIVGIIVVANSDDKPKSP